MIFRLTPCVKFFLISGVVCFVIQQTVDLYFGGNLLHVFGLVPAAIIFKMYFWQLFTYVFLHGDVLHLLLNLLMLAFIGAELEALWGSVRFLKYYFFCAMSAGIFYLLMQLVFWKNTGIYTPMVGASAGIYGLLLAYGLIFGERVFLFMLFFPMKAKHFIWILAGVEFLTTAFSVRGGVSSIAHLGGMLAGFCYLLVRATWQLRKNRKKEAKNTIKQHKSPNHLKLIIDNEKKIKPDPWSDVDKDPKTWH